MPPKKTRLTLSDMVPPAQPATTSPVVPEAISPAPVVATEIPAQPTPKAATAKKPERKVSRPVIARVTQSTLYIPHAVHRQLTMLALDQSAETGQRVKPHDLVLRGLDMVFRKHGLPSIAELTADEGL